MQNPEEIFSVYAADRRTLELEGFRAERLPHLLRYVSLKPGLEGIVMFACLEAGRESEQIAEQVAYFRALGQDFEWKIYDFDRPANLRTLLEEWSFVAEDAEGFMVYPLDAWTGETARDRPWDIRRVKDEAGVRDVVLVQEAVWRRDLQWVGDQLLKKLAEKPETLSLYCAYAGDTPIGTGWTDFPEGSSIPELHGGAVIEEWRGRGVYRDLYTIRFAEAAARRFRLMAVDASPMSRPILEKLGFVFVCNTVPMKYRVVGANHGQ